MLHAISRHWIGVSAIVTLVKAILGNQKDRH